MKKILGIKILGMLVILIQIGVMPAQAQSECLSMSCGLDEVTVTAGKKKDPESLQDVPFSVVAFNASTLDHLNIRDLQHLSFSSANVSLDEINTSRGTANFSIRGLGINSSIPSIDPTVGVFVDGVYLGSSDGVVFDVFDLDSIEILRGPQGVLFGRNTTGGAVLINTGNPTDTFQMKTRVATESPIDGGRGGLNTYVQTVISGPIVKDRLNGKIGFYYNDDEGYFKNLHTNKDHGAAKTVAIRGALEFLPTDMLTVLGKVEYFDSKGDGPSAQNRGVYSRNDFKIALDETGYYDIETLTSSWRTDYLLSTSLFGGEGVITNILGYRQSDRRTLGDIDASAQFIFHSPTMSEQKQISNELRYAESSDKMDITAGVYLFKQELAYHETRFLRLASGDFDQYGGGDQDHRIYGVFGQVEYELMDRLIGVFGLRYSREKKDVRVTYIGSRDACSVVNATCPIDGENGYSDKNDWSHLSPKIGFQYYLSSDDNDLDVAHIYGYYTQGVRSGGYNLRNTDRTTFLSGQVAKTGRYSFDEEQVDSFELGMKQTIDGGRGFFNLAGFYMDITDMQRELNLPSDRGVTQLVLNTADASIYGLELDFEYDLLNNLAVTGNLGWIDASYDKVKYDISGVDGVIDYMDKNLSIPRVPEVNWGIGFAYGHDLRSYGDIMMTLNYQYRDEVAYTDNNYGWISAINMLNVDVSWNTPYEGLSVSLYGKNLIDEAQAGGDTQLNLGTEGAYSDGSNMPFTAPAYGTFSPLKKGRLIGLELTFVY